MNAKQKRPWLRAAGVILAILLVAGAAGFFAIRKRIPPEFSKDIRAGLAARPIKDLDARLTKYLEERYGPMSDPINRQKAFLYYFNVDSAPQWAAIYTNEARVIVDTLFGGRDGTPIIGDAEPVHGARANHLGKNALYFDGRVEKARAP